MENQTGNSSSCKSGFCAVCQPLFDRVWAMIFNPQETWNTIKGEATNIKDFYLRYLMILAAIPAVCGFLGLVVFGMRLPFIGTVRVDFFPALGHHIFQYVLMLVVIYLVALLIQQLAPRFQGACTLLDALKLTGYSMTPGMVAGVFSLFPPLGFISFIAAIYGIYLLWLGVPVMIGVPQEKRPVFLAAVIVGTIIISFVLSVLIMSLAPDMAPSFTPPPGSSQQFDLQKFQEGMQQLQRLAPEAGR